MRFVTVRPPRSAARALTAGIAVVVSITIPSSCGTHGDGLEHGKIEIDRPTTTGGVPCDAPATAERLITEASLTATRADAATKDATRRQLDQLTKLVPPSLLHDVAALRRAFDQAWSGSRRDTDPFDATEYTNADQAVRRYVASGCTVPAS